MWVALIWPLLGQTETDWVRGALDTVCTKYVSKIVFEPPKVTDEVSDIVVVCRAAIWTHVGF